MEWPKKDNHKEEHNRLHVETTTWNPKDRKLLAKNTQPQRKSILQRMPKYRNPKPYTI